MSAKPDLRPPLQKWQTISVRAVNTSVKVGRGGTRFEKVSGRPYPHPRKP